MTNAAYTTRDARAAIERERLTRYWTIAQWKEIDEDNWPRLVAKTRREADEAVDWFADALDQLRSAWNAHFESCPKPSLAIPAPTEDELRAWRDAPSGTASA